MDQNQQTNTGMPQGGQGTPSGSTPPTPPTQPTRPTPPPSPMPSSTNNEQPSGSSFPAGNPFTPGQSGTTTEKENAIPAPPSQQDSVGVRTMASDMESVKQSGGQSPKSDIISAPEISQTPSDTSSVGTPPKKDASVSNETGAMSGTTPPISPSNVSGEPSMPSPQPGKSFSLKTMLIILGIIIAAAVVGYGVYYLVNSLNSSPSIPAPAQKTNPQPLPINTTPPTPQESTTTTSTSESPVIPEVIHQSIVSFDASTTQTLSVADLDSMRGAVTTATTPAMDDGQTREVMMNVAGPQQSATPINTKQFLSAYLPSLSGAASLFSSDLTTWLYFDGTPTASPKFGVALMLDDTASLTQASSTIAVVEQHLDEVANLFVPQVTAPGTPKFNDGTIGSVKVRFMVFSSGNVFEYGWANYQGHMYLLMATSYPQMKDIVSRLSLN